MSHYPMRILRRWARRYAAARRRQEKMRPENLLPRWDRACQRKWDIFERMSRVSPGEPALRWLERNGDRLRRIHPTMSPPATRRFLSTIRRAILP